MASDRQLARESEKPVEGTGSETVGKKSVSDTRQYGPSRVGISMLGSRDCTHLNQGLTIPSQVNAWYPRKRNE